MRCRRDRSTSASRARLSARTIFETLAIPILRGRPFTPHDTSGAPKVVIVNQVMAEKYWPAGNALGKRIQIGGPKPSSAEIVGIARTAKYRNLTEEPLPFLYLPLRQTDETFMYLFVDTKGDPASLIPAVRSTVGEIDPLQPIYDIHTVSDTVRRQALLEIRILAQVATGAGGVSVALSLLGLYAILAYSVNQRRREIGIRMAVGATNGRIFGMIVRNGLKLSLAGIAIGLFVASSVASTISQFLTPADPQNPVIYGAVAAFVGGVMLVSCYEPARRAARIDPDGFLRTE